MTFSFDLLAVAVAKHLGSDNAPKALGISGTTTAHLRRHGLTAYQADKLAVRIGLHPQEIWPNWCEGADELEEAAV